MLITSIKTFASEYVTLARVRTEKTVKITRETLGDEVTLMVGANSRYTPARAIEVGRLLPTAASAITKNSPLLGTGWTREVTAALDIDVTGGEQDNNMIVWKQLIDTHAVDIVQPDILLHGRYHANSAGGKLRQTGGYPLHSALGLPEPSHLSFRYTS